MNREILFRGKWNGIWVYGDLRQYSENRIGIYSYDLKRTVKGVDPATVGQYIGLCDKNGKRIFEGDILRDEYGSFLSIIFEEGAFCYKYRGDCRGYAFNDIDFDLYSKTLEIIGNIHDNPELLKGEQT